MEDQMSTNQQIENKSGHCDSVHFTSYFDLSLGLVVARYSLSVKGLWLVPVVSPILSWTKHPKSCQDLDPDKPGCTTSCGGDETDTNFCALLLVAHSKTL